MSVPTKVHTTGLDERAEELGLLTSAQVVQLTGITYRMLDYWCRRGLVTPKVAADGSGSARLWSPDVLAEIDDIAARIKACPYHPHTRGAAA